MQGVQGGRDGGGLISQSGCRPCSSGFSADLGLAWADIVNSLRQSGFRFLLHSMPKSYLVMAGSISLRHSIRWYYLSIRGFFASRVYIVALRLYRRLCHLSSLSSL